MAAADREVLRTKFDSTAGTYQSARPEYPSELFDDLLEIAGVSPPAALLEVGCGPGKATIPLARRGFRITAVELGASLAAAARENLVDFPDVQLAQAAFESWAPEPRSSFDLVYAATAWAWLDPEIRFAKAASLLSPGGHLAVWNAGHGFPAGFDQFFSEIQSVYDEIDEAHPGEWPPPAPEQVPDESASFEGSGLFEVSGVRRYLWAVDYDADGYIELLETFSGHIAMEPDKREHLYREMRRRIADRPSKTVHRHWVAVLTVGHLMGGS